MVINLAICLYCYCHYMASPYSYMCMALNGEVMNTNTYMDIASCMN